MKTFYFLLAGLCGYAAATEAGEIYKCVQDGKTVFQGVPCEGAGIKVQPRAATATTPNATTVNSETVDPNNQPTITKLKQNVKEMELERKQRETAYEIRDLEGDINSYQSAMDAELQALQRKKALAKNNLAGATWEQSISTEMQAVSQKYQSKMQIAEDRISQLQRQAGDLRREADELKKSGTLQPRN